jgi:hypothetical protein
MFGKDYIGKVGGRECFKVLTDIGTVIEVGSITLVYKSGDSNRECIYRLRKAVAKYGL